jgi:deoxyadenosine/deoxycytidine kinase
MEQMLESYNKSEGINFSDVFSSRSVIPLSLNNCNGVKIVSVDGNIGSGKSTLLTNLKKLVGFKNSKNRKIIFLKEPVDEWETIKDVSGNTMLQKFYADQKQYSFSFQMMAYISRLALLKTAIKENPDSIIITERSLYTDRFVFAKMLFESGKIEDVNYQIYLKWFDVFAEECPVHQVIYVKTDPEICHNRIMKRSREGEGGIPLGYLQECHEYHETMILRHFPDENICTDRLILDGNVDIYENTDQVNDWTDQILQYI